MIIDNKVIGLLGLANKPGGFTDDDARMASAFSEIAPTALINKRAEILSVRRSKEFQARFSENSLDIITILKEVELYGMKALPLKGCLDFKRKEPAPNSFEFVHPDDKEETLKIFSRAIENPGIAFILGSAV